MSVRSAFPRSRLARGIAIGGLALAAAWTGRVVGAAPTFHEQLAPVIYEHCAPCHRPGQSGPFPLLSFEDARKHGREMAEVTARRYMPPWLPAAGHGEFVGERRLSEEQIRLFEAWVQGGMVEGDVSKAVAVPPAPSDWELGPPDLIVRMPEAYALGPEGRDVYRHFVLPLPSSHDRPRHVRAWQFRPRSRAVHHIFLRLDRSGEARRRDARDPGPGFPGMDTPTGIESPPGHFASWQPGAGARRIPDGLAWTLAPRTDLVIQMHLQPQGRVEAIESEVGFYFTDDAPRQQPVKIALNNFDIDLAPGVVSNVVRDTFVLPGNADLLGVLPHTHYLGRRIEASAVLPDGTVRPLFLIPDWDFNWQGDYQYRQPVRLPAGTRVEMSILFDNSAGNPRNPSSPPRHVRYGPNTTDEMAELWTQWLPVGAADVAAFRKAAFDRGLRDVTWVNEQRLKLNPKDAVAHLNLGRVLLAQRKHDQAFRHFEDAVRLDPNLDDAHYFVGLGHRLANRVPQAMEAFARAVALNPDHARAQGNLGLVLIDAGQIDRAGEHLAAAVRLDPNDALATGKLGALRLYQDRVQEAVPLLERAMALDPADQETAQYLQQARRRLNPGPLAPP